MRIFLLLMCLATLSFTTAVLATGLSEVIVDTTVEWQPPSAGAVLSSNPFTPVWHFHGSTYLIWLDSNNRPWVTKTTQGVATTVPLDTNPDYSAQPDGHHRFSMGIDKNGYIHITGDMHNYSNLTTGVIKPYPARYQKQAILYWKSNKPESISGGFSFVGGYGASTAIPGTGWLTGHFFSDQKGELYYASQVHAIEAGHYPGEMGVGLYKYDTQSSTWTALGGLANDTRPGTYEKVLYWENSGFAPSKWFQNYWSSFTFDNQNRLHFAVSGNTDSNLGGSNKLIYAVSKDGGLSWSKADGTLIKGLPIRGADGVANQGDIVASTQGPNFIGAEISVAVDKNGMPGVYVDNLWRTWDGKSWTTKNNQNLGDRLIGTYGYLDRDKHLAFPIARTAQLLRACDFSSPLFGYDFLSYSSYVSLNEAALKTEGEVYGVGLTKNGTVQTFLKTTFTPSPLPLNWGHKDIGLAPPSFQGTAGYRKGSFVVNNYGSGIDGYADSFHYVYKELNGDGFILARVNSSLPSPAGYSAAGLMMRENLAANSKQVMQLIAPGTDTRARQGSLFGYRSSTAGYTVISSLPGIPTPYWVKLVRAGDSFTGFISKEGNTWIQTGKIIVPMSAQIYVGLAASSNGKSFLMQTATFDYVNAPALHGKVSKLQKA